MYYPKTDLFSKITFLSTQKLYVKKNSKKLKVQYINISIPLTNANKIEIIFTKHESSEVI
jgi:hypothetical protein